MPEVLDREVIDEVVGIEDEDALDTARAVAQREGLLVGISAGAAIRAALDLAAKEEMAGKRIVVIVPGLRRALHVAAILRPRLTDPRP